MPVVVWHGSTLNMIDERFWSLAMVEGRVSFSFWRYVAWCEGGVVELQVPVLYDFVGGGTVDL